MGQISKVLTYFSFARFSFEGLMIILYGLERCHTNSSIPSNYTNSSIIISNETATSLLMTMYELEDKDLWVKDFLILIGNLFLWRVLAYIALRLRVDHNFLRLRY